MQAIGLVEPSIHRHTIEQKRIKRHAMRLRKLGIDAVESRRNLAQLDGAIIPVSSSFGGARLYRLIIASRWHAPAAGPIPRSASLRQFEITTSGFSASAHRSGARHLRSYRRRPSIDDMGGDAVGAQPCFERSGRLVGRQPEPGGDAVAKGEDLRRSRDHRGGSED